MENELQKEEPLFIIDDKAYIFIRIWSFIFSIASILGVYLLFDGFIFLIEHDKRIIVAYILFIFIIISETIKLLLVFIKKNKVIKFFNDKIVRTHDTKEVFIGKMKSMDKFNTLLQYNGERRLKYKGFIKVIINIGILGLIFMLIAYPKILIAIFYYIFFYFLSIAIYSLIINKKIQLFNLSMLDIEGHQVIITLLLDDSDDTKKIEKYFKDYKNIEIKDIPKKFI